MASTTLDEDGEGGIDLDAEDKLSNDLDLDLDDGIINDTGEDLDELIDYTLGDSESKRYCHYR